MDSFTTTRLTAERLRPHHLPDMAALHRDPEVARYLGDVSSEAATAAYLERKLAHWDQHGFGLWVLRTKDGTFTGRAGIGYVEIDGAMETDVSYTFKRAAWGQGLATEITLALVDIALHHLNLSTLIGFASAENTASLRVLQKTCFLFERRTTFKGTEVVVCRHAPRPPSDSIPS